MNSSKAEVKEFLKNKKKNHSVTNQIYYKYIQRNWHEYAEEISTCTVFFFFCSKNCREYREQLTIHQLIYLQHNPSKVQEISCNLQ